MPLDLPEPIATYFAADRKRDMDLFASSFTQDAVVTDERQRHQGPAAIRKWNMEAHQKYSYTTELLDAAEQDGKTVVHGRISGNFPGSPAVIRYSFTLADGKIAMLKIG